MASSAKRPAARRFDDGKRHLGGIAMKFEVRVQATTNEKRRFAGGADISPMFELVSIMLDQAMMVVVDARLAALTSDDGEDVQRESA